jgi:hypothetical protein
LKKCFANGSESQRIMWKFESDYSAQYDFKNNVRLE